ncbi:GspE/PulE family protein [Amantichitinum ursilacus]|uniref:GspE/PulE family protein n=1 Tax=Amantichitinum ursilacus TaxID=857265 RepID=UPI0013792471|nr:GspE/PulE family protein [Amantichitinum ursilacus]
MLDALLRHWPDRPEALSAALQTHAGVLCVDEAQPWSLHPQLRDLAVARTSRAVPVIGLDSSVVIVAADPWDDRAIKAVQRHIGAAAPALAVTEELLQRLLEMSASSSVSGTGASLRADAAGRPADHSVGGPVVSFVEAAIARAVQAGASDIHFECDRNGLTVKHRLDGVMQRFARMDGHGAAQEVISRIKVLGQLDITERRLPQDGRFRYESKDTAMDLRVSIMPSIHGEDAVLRLLDKAQFKAAATGISMESLGFDAGRSRLIRTMAREPNGMMLVTGPTGSGKTTTLYAVLSEINTGLEKIITIEDPVEYELEGVLQIPVNERKGLTFAKGLRSILRHDPDQILVGEIRDAETAEIAVQASLTGHQVFTTVHANNVADIMGRFKHFGIDMFGFTSALNGVIVQRLVRHLCPLCARQEPIDEAQRAIFERAEINPPDTVPVAVGCDACHGYGYTGRFVLTEVHQINDDFRDLVMSNASLSALKQHFRAQQVMPLAVAGLYRVLAGETTLEELQRVVGAL